MISRSAGHPFFPGAATRSHVFIETSSEINKLMKMHVVNLTERILKKVGKRLYGAKVAVMTRLQEKHQRPLGGFLVIKIVEEAHSQGGCTIFLVDHDVFRGISAATVMGLMISSVVVDGKNLFASEERIVHPGIRKGNKNAQ